MNSFSFEYALIAMFIGLIIYQLRGRKYVMTGAIAGVLAIIFSIAIPGNWYIILASMLAAIIGVVISRRLEWA